MMTLITLFSLDREKAEKLLDSAIICRYNQRMQNLEPQKLVEASPLFRGLQPEEAAVVIARLQPAHFKRGARIMERGVWHGQLHIIASGQVSVLLQEGSDDAGVTTGRLQNPTGSLALAVAQLG